MTWTPKYNLKWFFLKHLRIFCPFPIVLSYYIKTCFLINFILLEKFSQPDFDMCISSLESHFGKWQQRPNDKVGLVHSALTLIKSWATPTNLPSKALTGPYLSINSRQFYSAPRLALPFRSPFVKKASNYCTLWLSHAAS